MSLARNDVLYYLETVRSKDLEKGWATANDIAKAVHLPYATVLSVLRSLVDEGYVEMQGEEIPELPKRWFEVLNYLSSVGEASGDDVWRIFASKYKWRNRRAMGRILLDLEKRGLIERELPIITYPPLRMALDIVESKTTTSIRELARELKCSYETARRYLRRLARMHLVRRTKARRPITYVRKGKTISYMRKVIVYAPTYKYKWKVKVKPAIYRAVFIYLRELTVYINYTEGTSKPYEYKVCHWVRYYVYKRYYVNVYRKMKRLLLKVFYWLSTGRPVKRTVFRRTPSGTFQPIEITITTKIPPVTESDLEEGATNREAWVPVRVFRENVYDLYAFMMIRPNGTVYRIGEGKGSEIMPKNGEDAYYAVHWYPSQPKYLGFNELYQTYSVHVKEGSRLIKPEISVGLEEG